MRAAETVDMAGGVVVRIMTSGAPAYQHQHLPSPSPHLTVDTAETRTPPAPRGYGPEQGTSTPAMVVMGLSMGRCSYATEFSSEISRYI